MKIDGHKFIAFGHYVGRTGYFLPSFEEETIITSGLAINIMFTYSRKKIPHFYDTHVAFCHIECDEPMPFAQNKLIEVYRVIPPNYPIQEIEKWNAGIDHHFYAYIPRNYNPVWLAQLAAFSDNEMVKGNQYVILQFDKDINLKRFTTLFNLRYCRIIQSLDSHLRVNPEELETYDA